MSFSKENYELYKAGFKAQAKRIQELEKELRELRQLKEEKNVQLRRPNDRTRN